MDLECDKNYAYNAFIFNWVKNYDDQIITLIDGIESLQNKVQLYNHLTYNQLISVVQRLSHANFELYNYIVVVILDNECELKKFIKTSDKQNVLINSKILAPIQSNPSLKGVTRLFVTQKLLDCTDMDDENVHKIGEMVIERQCKLKQSNALYSGLTISIRADEYTTYFTHSPFIKVFSRNFRNYAIKLPMDKIHKGMLKEIKYQRGYKMNIEFGSNATNTNNLLLGNGICCDFLRDFS